jgi:hypothetical protein
VLFSVSVVRIGMNERERKTIRLARSIENEASVAHWPGLHQPARRHYYSDARKRFSFIDAPVIIH